MVNEELFGADNFLLEITGSTLAKGFTQTSDANTASLTTLGGNLQSTFSFREEKADDTKASVPTWSQGDWNGNGVFTVRAQGAEIAELASQFLMPIEDVFGAHARHDDFARDEFQFVPSTGPAADANHKEWVDIIVVQPFPAPGGSAPADLSFGSLTIRGDTVDDDERFDLVLFDFGNTYSTDGFDFAV